MAAAHCSLLLLLLVLLLRLRFSVSAVPSVISRKAVARLPGFSGPLPFSLETGYVEVDDVRLFYYFIQSERNPEEDPVLFWLTGGPGCSAFSGLVYEIGPLSFDFDGYRGGLPTLLYKPAAWTKNKLEQYRSGEWLKLGPPIASLNIPLGYSLPFSLETGYVEVDGVRLFYYFIQSERNPEEDPVLLWLTGGPGCSAFSGLVYEIGPLSFDFDGYRGGLPTVLYKPAAWTKVSNIIFVDAPAGTGFSYATTDNRLVPNDTMVVHQLHIFLGKWFDEHPQFLLNPLYIAGDSYSGIIIPSLALEIAKGIESSDERLVNLKGYIAGNPVTDGARFDGNAQIPFLHGMGITPDELYEVARESCRGEYKSPLNVQCANSIQAINDCIRDVNEAHVLEPRCDEYESLIIHKSTLQDGREMLLESAVSSICRNATYFLSEVWANDETVRESLGIHKGTVPSWKRCDFHIPYTKEIMSTVEHHLNLITKGYRAMVYNGDHDSRISTVGTQAWIRYLNLSISDDWRPWYVAGQVVGFTRTYSNNLTYATVKGAGHTAPEYMPRECLAMVDRWLSGDPL